MIHAVVAEKMGVILSEAASLLNGRVYASVAGTLGVPMVYVESYINGGEASIEMADRLRVNIAAAEDLGRDLGREGRIGLIFGLLL